MLSSSYPKFSGDTTAPFVESIAAHIAARGHSVEILLPEHRDLRRARVKDGVRLHTYRYSPNSTWTPWGYAESLAGDVRIKPGAYLIAPAALASALVSMLRLTACEQFDLIHAHWVIPNGLPAALAARVRKIPLVTSLHGSDVFLAEKYGVIGRVAGWCFSRSDAITASSADLITRAVRLGAEESRTEFLPYGADLKSFSVDGDAALALRDKLRRRAGDIVVLAVGRLVHKKGFEFLLQALAQVIISAPEVSLIIAGEGDLRVELERQAGQLGIKPHVFFAGKVSREQIPTYFAAADIVAVPSVRDEAGNVDGLPNVALEAMAAGKPLIASHVGGLPQVVRNGVSGLLVEEKNAKELAAAILNLAKSPEMRSCLGMEARRLAREGLSWEMVADKFISVYERVTGRGDASRGDRPVL